MSNKRPQPTATLVKRLVRVATALDVEAARCLAAGNLDVLHALNESKWRARANTCLQAAGRLADSTEVLSALIALRDAVRASKKLDGREYVSLGIRVNAVIEKAEVQ